MKKCSVDFVIFLFILINYYKFTFLKKRILMYGKVFSMLICAQVMGRCFSFLWVYNNNHNIIIVYNVI